MSVQWQKQVCLLTGASGGIGQAIAKRLADSGARLILTGRNAQKLSELAEALPGQHRILCVDITRPDDREKIANVCQEMGLTLLINNAGVSCVGDFHGVPAQAVEDVMTVNLLAPVALTQRLLPVLRRSEEARVVNIGSTFGSVGFPYHSIYCASKFGLRGWTESLSREYRDTSVSFHYLAPRATNTAINNKNVVAMNQALGNETDAPEVVADALMLQLSKSRRRWFIGSPEKWFVRLNGALPELVDFALAKKLTTIRQFVSSAKEEKWL
ncbi:SDR family oxidoreductase [Alteromonas sp. NFXS44]|uniref:SDR family oxidoreductase n=1 Tax=Alteromonas sp. NFXS44 TaxID=2818435 RepID=UPI0032DF63EE